MGNSNSTATATEGINKLKMNKPLVMKYFHKSVLYKNYMNTRCLKVKIPGDEIDQKSSFYVYNIEGFFDIEKGIYFYLIQTLETMRILEENNVEIKDYNDLETKVNSLLYTLQLLNFIGNFSFQKTAPQKETEKKCVCTEVIEEKKNESISFSFPSINFSWNWNKSEEKTLKQNMKMEEQENLKEEINNIDLNSISTCISLAIPLMITIQPYIANRIPGIKKAIKWLENIIPFNELRELVYVLLKSINGAISGTTNIIKGISTFPQNKVLSVLHFATGLVELGKVGVDAMTTYKAIKNQQTIRKRTKAQENFLSIIDQIQNKITELINSNLEELKKNNIIILGIDESEDNYNEETGLQLFKIDNIDNYAKCLSDIEDNRFKYIKNMIYFYDKILPRFSQLTNKGENEKYELDFLLSLQEFIIKNCNNKDFWISINEESMEQFINNMEKEYERRKNYFKDNANEIKKKIIEAFGKDEEKNEINSKSSTNIQDSEPPAPIIDTKNDELKEKPRKCMTKNIEEYDKYSLKELENIF